MLLCIMKYDLETRTAAFGGLVIAFAKGLPRDLIGDVVVVQLVRSATSIGANYAEANGASSKRDFRNKIFLCKKEAQETRHWLRMCASAFPERTPKLKALAQEAHELTLIFQKIASSPSLKEV